MFSSRKAASRLTSLLLAVVFVTLGSLRVLLIKFSANEDGKYEYLPVTVNVSAELLKLLVSVGFSSHIVATQGSFQDYYKRPSQTQLLQMMKWSIPGFLYFCDNLLAFYVIKYLQPALVVLMGNFVIVTTSVLYRLILHRRLSHVQWVSLAILFLSIMSLSNQSSGSSISHHEHLAVNHLVEEGPEDNSSSLLTHTSADILHIHSICQPKKTVFQVQNTSSWSPQRTTQDTPSIQTLLVHRQGHILIILQCFLASLANVYNEKIFKEGNGMQESIYVQNSRLYFFGVVFNFLSFVIPSTYRHRVFVCGFFHGHNAYSILLIFVTALHGLNVAFILKFRNNMFHVMSSQVITIIVVSSSMYFFGFVPTLDFFLSGPIVLLAIGNFHLGRRKESVTMATEEEEESKEDCSALMNNHLLSDSDEEDIYTREALHD